MGYYSDGRNTYQRQNKMENPYISPQYSEISYTGLAEEAAQGGNYLGYADTYPEENHREPPRRRTRKKIRVPSIDILGLRVKIPSLQILLLLAAGILAAVMKYKILIWAIGALGIFTFMSMSGARYSRLVFPQRILSLVVSFAMVLLAVFGNGIGFWPAEDIDITLSGNGDDLPPAVTVGPPTVATEPTTIPTEPPTIATTAPPPPPETKPLRLSHDGINLDMQLYYNENGGNYYHTTDMCSAVGADYLPLTGKLIYEELSVGKFKSLKRCTTCSAPVRPHTH